jgi:hypothetical protein
MRQIKRAGGITAALAGAFALLLGGLTAPAWAGGTDSPPPDEALTCEGSPAVLGHEWQQQRRTREHEPAVEEQSHLVYSYKQEVEKFKTEHEYRKEVRGYLWQRDNGRWSAWHKTGRTFGWTVWTPESIKWRGADFAETGPHHGIVREWTESNGNKRWREVSTEYRYAPTGNTRQVADGYEWQYSGEVTEPRDEPWALLPGYPRKEVTQEAKPETFTEWSEWADYGDVVRTDEQVEPDLPDDTDVIEHRWVYVDTYVRIEAVPPSWQDTDPEGDCYTGPEEEDESDDGTDDGQSGDDESGGDESGQGTDEETTDEGTDDESRDEEPRNPDTGREPEREREVLFKHKTCDGVFERYVVWEYPADGGERVPVEHGDEKVRDLTVKEAERLGCIETPPPPKEEPKEGPKEGPREELAETGVNPLVTILTALGMAGTGAALLVARSRKRAGLR